MLPRHLALQKGDAGIDFAEPRLRLLILGPHGFDLGEDHAHLRLGPRHRDLYRCGIDTEQQLTFLYRLVVAHGHVGHTALDIGADLHDVGFDVSVVRRDIAAADQVEIDADGDSDHRNDDEQDGP